MSVAPPQELLQFFHRPSTWLLTSHSNPDGDAVGSQIAMYRLLTQNGHEVRVVNHDSVPKLYRGFLAGTPWSTVGNEPFDASGCRNIVLMECPTPERSGLDAASLQGLGAVNIDHHLGNTDYGAANWVDPRAASVSVLVLRLAKALDWTVDAQTAQAIFLGLVTDTGGFRYSNANREAFEVAAQVRELGADPEELAHELYERRSLASLQLLREALGTLQLDDSGQVAVAGLTHEMFDRAGATSEDTEGLIEQIRTLDGVVAVALLRQVGDQQFKASLRSRGEVSVEVVARASGGGGHRNAAGCLLSGSLDELLPDLLGRLEGAVRASEASEATESQL